MKQLFMSLLLSIGLLPVFSQAVDLRRKIDVTGMAESEVVPDIIYVSISLQEYFNGSKKMVTIDELEKQLQDAVVKAGIPKENLTVNNVSGYNYTWERKKNPNFAASKQYRLKLGDISKFNQVLAPLDPKSVQYTNIESYEHSKMAEFKKELRKKALAAASEKAGYLAEVLNDEVGDALQVEVIESENGPMPMYANTMARFKSEDAAGEPADIGFKNIKLTAQVRVVFELR